MKIKTLLQIGITLLISGLLISCNKDLSYDPSQQRKIEIKKAIATLSSFGSQIEKAGKVTPEEIEIISAIAKIPLFIPKIIVNHGVSATGINFNTKKAIVINSINGKEVVPCSNTGGIEQTKRTVTNKCKTQAIAPNAAVKTALSIKEPIKGFILKGNERIEATYIVSTVIQYKGSHCETNIFGDTQHEDCSSIPNIPWP